MKLMDPGYSLPLISMGLLMSQNQSTTTRPLFFIENQYKAVSLSSKQEITSAAVPTECFILTLYTRCQFFIKMKWVRQMKVGVSLINPAFLNMLTSG